MTLPPDPRTTYDAHEPVEDAPRGRKHELVGQVKRLVELTARLAVGLLADLDDLVARLAAAFGDLLGAAQLASEREAYTGTLTVRMRRPTPLNRGIHYEAGVDRVDG